jgi:putative sterol carrier protein
MTDSVKEMMASMVDRFNPEAWGAQDAVMAFDISGDQGGKWVARVEGGKLSITEGTTDAADMTMTCSDTDLIAMIRGEQSPVSLFMGGKLKIDGNMSLAMKLQSLIGG